MPPEGSILLHYLEGVKEKVRKGELIDMAKGQKSIPSKEDPVAIGLKSRPIPNIFPRMYAWKSGHPWNNSKTNAMGMNAPFATRRM
jgi:hypothetical protein